MAAADHGDLDLVDWILRKLPDVDLDARDNRGSTALMHAADSNEEEIVKRLLEAGVSVTPRDAHGDSALSLALMRGDSKSCAEQRPLCRLLLDAGADPLDVGRDELGRELERALDTPDPGTIRRLLDGGAPANFWTYPEGEPLTRAVQSQNTEIVRMLLEAGADPSGDGGWPCPLVEAAMEGADEMGQLLLDAGADPNDGCGGFNTYLLPLSAAALNHRVSFARLLLDAGADPSASGLPSPLVAAAVAGSAPIAQMLLDAGAALDDQSNLGGCIRYWNGGTALAWAAYEGHVEVVRVLLRRGADPNAAPGESDPPLVAAALGAHPEAARALIEGGAEVRPRFVENTPLQALNGVIRNAIDSLAQGWEWNLGWGCPRDVLPRALSMLEELKRAGAVE